MVYQYNHEYVIYILWKLGRPVDLSEIISNVEQVSVSVKTRPGKQFRVWIPKALKSLVRNRELLEVTEDGCYTLSARGHHYVCATCSQVEQFNEGGLSDVEFVRAFLKHAKDVRTNKLLDKHIDLREEILVLKERNMKLEKANTQFKTRRILKRRITRGQKAPYACASLPTILSGSGEQQWTQCSPRTPDRRRTPQDAYPSPQSIPRYQSNAEAGASTFPTTPSRQSVSPENDDMDVELEHEMARIEHEPKTTEHEPEIGLEVKITALAEKLEDCRKIVEELQVAASLDLEIRKEKDKLANQVETMATEMDRLKETHKVDLETLQLANTKLQEQVEALESQIEKNKAVHKTQLQERETAHKADLASKKQQMLEMCETMFPNSNLN